MYPSIRFYVNILRKLFVLLKKVLLLHPKQTVAKQLFLEL